jgi:hypothetical protein
VACGMMACVGCDKCLLPKSLPVGLQSTTTSRHSLSLSSFCCCCCCFVMESLECRRPVLHYEYCMKIRRMNDHSDSRVGISHQKEWCNRTECVVLWVTRVQAGRMDWSRIKSAPQDFQGCSDVPRLTVKTTDA